MLDVCRVRSAKAVGWLVLINFLCDCDIVFPLTHAGFAQRRSAGSRPRWRWAEAKAERRLLELCFAAQDTP